MKKCILWLIGNRFKNFVKHCAKDMYVCGDLHFGIQNIGPNSTELIFFLLLTNLSACSRFAFPKSDTIQVHFSGRIIKSDTCFTNNMLCLFKHGICLCVFFNWHSIFTSFMAFVLHAFVCMYVIRCIRTKRMRTKNASKGAQMILLVKYKENIEHL